MQTPAPRAHPIGQASAERPRILVLWGPNLNLLGTREPAIYGSMSFEEINTRLREEAAALGCEVEIFQSNSEGELVSALHGAMGRVVGVVLNPGAYSHYGYALRDAIAASELPVMEVHFSNVYAREPFRHTSVVAPVCHGVIVGLGWRGMGLGLRALVELHQAGHP